MNKRKTDRVDPIPGYAPSTIVASGSVDLSKLSPEKRAAFDALALDFWLTFGLDLYENTSPRVSSPFAMIHPTYRDEIPPTEEPIPRDEASEK